MLSPYILLDIERNIFNILKLSRKIRLKNYSKIVRLPTTYIYKKSKFIFIKVNLKNNLIFKIKKKVV